MQQRLLFFAELFVSTTLDETGKIVVIQDLQNQIILPCMYYDFGFFS